MRKGDLVFNIFLVPLDLALLLASALGAYFLRLSPLVADWRPVLFNLPLRYYFSLSLFLSIFFIIIFAVSGLYLVKRSTSFFHEFLKVFISVSAGFTVIILFMFFNRAWFDSRFILLAVWIFAILFVILGRVSTRVLRRFLVEKTNFGHENLLIIGNSQRAHQIEKQVLHNKKLGFNLSDILTSPDLDSVRSICKNKFVHHVLVADSDFDRQEVLKVVNFCEENGIDFSFIPDMFGSISADMSFDTLEGVPVVSIKPSPLTGWGRALKRFVDLILSIFALFILSPLFLIFVVLIKLDSKGPIFVKLKRVSNGKEFYLYKFRSMIDNAESYKKELEKFNEREDGPLFKMKNDPRITKIGKKLRSHRFDELPQLFNVFRGEISFVGPRPHEPAEVEKYKDYHKKVLAIKSGITGLAQISGASDLSFDEEVKLDRYYIENWSFKKDIIILFKTIYMFLFDKTGV